MQDLANPYCMLKILMSTTYLSVSLTNNSDSWGNLCCIDYYLKYRQNQYNSKTKQFQNTKLLDARQEISNL